jgi:MFS family permease
VRAGEGPTRRRSPFGFTFVAPLVLGSVLNPINSTMLATALVPIAESLGTDIAATGWLIAALYLTTAVAQPTLGRLVDLLGARRIFLASLGLVGAAGLCGQFAASLAGLVAVRILLGVGTSGAYPAAMRILRERGEATGSKPPRFVFGVLTLSAFSTTAVGPVIGGLLISAFGWQSIFTINVPLALIAALSILIWTPRDRTPAHTFGRLVKDIDLVGIALFAAFLLSLMAFLMNPKNGPAWLALAGSIVFGAGLVWHSLRRKQPFLDLRMMARNWPLTMTYLRAAAISVIVFSIYYGFAQWLQSAVGYSSAGAGLVTLPMSAVAAGIAHRRAHQGAARTVPYRRRRGARGQRGFVVRRRREPAVDDRHGDHTLRCHARYVQHRDAGGRLYPGSSRGDRHRRRTATHGAIYRRHRRSELARIDLRRARQRSRPAQPCRRGRRAQRHPSHRHPVRSHAVAHGGSGRAGRRRYPASKGRNSHAAYNPRRDLGSGGDRSAKRHCRSVTFHDTRRIFLYRKASISCL